MINVSIQLDTYKRSDGTHCVRLRLTGNGSAKIRLKVAIPPNTHWDNKTKTVTKKYGDRGKEELNQIIRREHARLEDFIREIQADRWGFSCAKIKSMYLNQSSHGTDLIEYYKKEIAKLEERGRKGLAKSRFEAMIKLIEHIDKSACEIFKPKITEYRREKDYKGVSEILSFIECKPLYIERISRSFLEDFDANMSCRGPNSRGKHLRDIKAVLSRAIDDFDLQVKDPFKRFAIPKSTTPKKWLPVEDIRDIAQLEIDNPLTAYHRDWFIFSFLMGGMSFIDVYWVDQKVKGDYVVYRRGKIREDTDPEIVQTIIPERAKDFLKKKRPSGSYEDYKSESFRGNKQLKIVKKMAGIEKTLSHHVARHSWNMAAKSLGYPLQLRQEIMGHKSAHGAIEHYEGGFDQAVKDECVLRVAALIS